MSIPQIAVVRNKSERSISIVADNRQVVIQPFAEEPMIGDLAQKFLAMHPQAAELVSDSPVTADAPVAPPREFWVANATGNPAAPATYSDMVYDPDKKTRTERLAPNPYAKPYAIKMKMQGGERFYLGPNGEHESVYLPAYNLEIAPYTARKVPENLWRWALGRAAASSINGLAEMVQCEPFPAFLPKASWGIDALRVYIQLQDPSILGMMAAERNALLGPSAAQIKAKTKNDADAAIAQSRACNELMKHIFFRLIDSRYARPTKEEFDAMSGKIQSATSAADAAADAVVSAAEKKAG